MRENEVSDLAFRLSDIRVKCGDRGIGQQAVDDLTSTRRDLRHRQSEKLVVAKLVLSGCDPPYLVLAFFDALENCIYQFPELVLSPNKITMSKIHQRNP